MIFDHKHIDEISDDEIERIVDEHFGERQYLEFKVTVNHQDDKDRIELLKDIASLANGGGGYLIIGIRDDGKGNAQKFEPNLVGDTKRLKKAISDLCIDHISERIEGLEIDTREIGKNQIVIVRIPESIRKPHMVTYNDSTIFVKRYNDGKRSMKLSEIKQAFNNDYFGQKLSIIESFMKTTMESQKSESKVKEILERIDAGITPSLSLSEDANFLKNLMRDRFENEIGTKSYFWISATPENPRQNLIEINSIDIRDIIQNPPGSRNGGWNMATYPDYIENFPEGIYIGDKKFRFLELLNNGHIEFWTPIDSNFCWKQSPEEFRIRPRLYPCAVVEYPTSFLRLLRALIDKSDIDENFIVSLQYSNIKGHTMLPYAPGIVGFELPTNVQVFDKKHIKITKNIPNDFKPDKTAYEELIKPIYSYFGLNENTIPFYKTDQEKIEFPN